MLNSETIERTQANDLADLFRSTPSVAVGGGVGIAQKIYVRGLEDSLLNVTVDGAPQRGTLFHHIGRVSIEPELLETVSLQAGAGEATAGFGAVGGAIRFRTRNPVDLLELGQDFGAMLKAGWFSNDGQKYSATGYGRLFGDVGVLASYVHVDRDNYQDGDGTERTATGAIQELGFLKIGGDLGDGHRISASYEVRNEAATFGQRPNWAPLANGPVFPGEGQRDTAVLNHGYDAGNGFSIESTAYWTKTAFTQNRTDRWGLYGSEIESTGFDVRGRFETANNTLIVGVENRNDTVVAQYLDDPAKFAPFVINGISRFEESGELYGLYAQNQWQVTDRLLVSVGARFDDYELDLDTYGGGTTSTGVSFNGGLNYEIVDGLTFNAGYAEAFRGKEIGDGFTLGQSPGQLSLQPNLQPETVENVEVGLKWARDGFTASAVYFDMAIDDVILDQLGRRTAARGAVVNEASAFYENVGRFESDGIELRAGYRWDEFAIDGFFNSYDSTLNGNPIEGYELIALGNSMGDNWNLSGSWDPSDRFGLSASVTHVQDLNDIEVLFRDVELGFIDSTRFVDKPGYTVLDLFGRWQPLADQNVELLAAVYNVFDEQYRAHASVADYSGIAGYEIVQGVPEPGRNVRLSVALKF